MSYLKKKDIKPNDIRQNLGRPDEVAIKIDLERTFKGIIGVMEVKQELENIDENWDVRINNVAGSNNTQVKLVVPSKSLDALYELSDDLAIVTVTRNQSLTTTTS